MQVLVALTVGLVTWIVLWALGVKAFDAFLITLLLVVSAAAALHVAEHRRARLVARSLLDLALEALADAAQALVPEFVDAASGDGLHGALDWRGALGRHHDREVAPALVAALDQAADLLDVE